LTFVPQKDCYNVTYIYILYLSLSLSEFLKRLVLHLPSYLQKNSVTGFCNKLGVFCYIVTRLQKVLRLEVLPCGWGKVIVAEPACCNGESESSKLRSFWFVAALALAHARTHARALALTLTHGRTTMTFSKRTIGKHAQKSRDEKKPPCGGLVETLGFINCDRLRENANPYLGKVNPSLIQFFG
jgi:hypothetical protein